MRSKIEAVVGTCKQERKRKNGGEKWKGNDGCIHCRTEFMHIQDDSFVQVVSELQICRG